MNEPFPARSVLQAYASSLSVPLSRSDRQSVALIVASAQAVPQLADHYRVDEKGFSHMIMREGYDSSRRPVVDRRL